MKFLFVLALLLGVLDASQASASATSALPASKHALFVLTSRDKPGTESPVAEKEFLPEKYQEVFDGLSSLGFDIRIEIVTRFSEVEDIFNEQSGARYELIVLGGHGTPGSVKFGNKAKGQNKLTVENAASLHLSHLLSDSGLVYLDSCNSGFENPDENLRPVYAASDSVSPSIGRILSLAAGVPVVAPHHTVDKISIELDASFPHGFVLTYGYQGVTIPAVKYSGDDAEGWDHFSEERRTCAYADFYMIRNLNGFNTEQVLDDIKLRDTWLSIEGMNYALRESTISHGKRFFDPVSVELISRGANPKAYYVQKCGGNRAHAVSCFTQVKGKYNVCPYLYELHRSSPEEFMAAHSGLEAFNPLENIDEISEISYLRYAAETGNYELALYFTSLLSHGIGEDSDCRNLLLKLSFTEVDSGKRASYQGLVRALLENGLDLSLKDSAGESAVTIAEDEDNGAFLECVRAFSEN